MSTSDPTTQASWTAADAPTALLLGPHLDAVSGVSTHVLALLRSRLTERYSLAHFQVGSEGRTESRLGRLGRLLSSPARLGFAIVTSRAAIVHLNTSLDARAVWRDLVYAAVAKLCRARVVCQVHGGALPERFARGRLARALLRRALGLADTIVVLSLSELEAYRRFLPGHRVARVPNAIDCRPYLGCGCAGSNAEEPLRLVYVGRLANDKGLRELLDGLATTTRQGVRAQLSIAGSGRDASALHAHARALGLDNVSFLGPVRGLEKARLLGRADVFVLPSYSEGLPYALLEAMAAGTAVLATPVGAITDVVSEGVHGWLVPTRDADAIAAAITRLAADREAVTQAGAACRRRVVKHYSAERLATEFGGLYSSLTEPAARARTSA